MTPLVVEHAAAQGGVRCFLISLENGGVDPEAAGVGLFGEALERELPGHFGDKVGFHRKVVDLALDVERLLGGGGVLFGSQIPQTAHAIQDVLLAGAGALWVDHRVECRGRFGQTGQHRRFSGRNGF